jgi:thiamine biosynthesis lipoprotein
MWSISSKCKLSFIIVLMLALSSLTACRVNSNAAAEPVTKTEFALDTLCSITIYDKPDEEIFKDCFQRIKEIENKMSVDLPDSEVSAINKNAGLKPVSVSEDTYTVIRAGIKYSQLTNGDFDISVGPLVKLWGITKPDPKVPSPEAIQTAVELVNYKNIVLNDTEKSVFLKEKGMSLDLGGIAKGYTGDAVAKILKDRRVKHAIVDLGGNLVAVGSKLDGTDWKVGIQTPFKTNGDYFAVIGVSGKAVVTSGIYQRYFKKNGKIYHHIMNTHTGYPMDSGLVSVSVVSGSSMDADALAKAFTLGLEAGMKYIIGQKNVEAIFLTDKNEVYVTPGLKGRIEITDDKYKLVE